MTKYLLFKVIQVITMLFISRWNKLWTHWAISWCIHDYIFV